MFYWLKMPKGLHAFVGMILVYADIWNHNVENLAFCRHDFDVKIKIKLRGFFFYLPRLNVPSILGKI